MNPKDPPQKPNPMEITYNSSINKSFFVNPQEINPQVDSRVFLKDDNVFNKARKKKNNNKVKNLSQELKNWLNISMIKLNDRNSLDDLDQLLRYSQKYKKAIKDCQQSKQKFNDAEFKKNTESLLGYYINDPHVIEKNNLINWDSFENFFPPPYIVYKDINFDDILQGSLGDCYLLAAISSIARFPQRLKRIFLIKEHNPLGIYVVALCINGIWQDVILDEFFPVNLLNRKPAFNSTKSRALWVMLLEKAYAKIHGGYYNINSGLCREAL